jgi:SAM-dependent methyltransferase
MDVEKHWWKEFFSGKALDLWRAVTTAEQTRAEADFLVSALRITPGSSVLNVPCGGGRLELALRGFRATGVEYSEEFIQKAREKSRERSLAVNWRQLDMRELSGLEPFDGAFCFGNSFGYLDDEENFDFLRAVAKVLKPGARFALDTTCLELVLRVFEQRSWFEAGGLLMLERNEYDLLQSRMNTEYTFVGGGETERKRGSQRYYAYAELCGLLKGAGFTNLHGFGSLNRDPVTFESSRVILVGEKV